MIIMIFLITSFKDFLSLRSGMFCLCKWNIVKYYPATSYQERKKFDFKKTTHKTFGRYFIVSFYFPFNAWYLSTQVCPQGGI